MIVHRVISLLAVLLSSILGIGASHWGGWEDLLDLQTELHPDKRPPPVYVAQSTEIHGRGVFASEDLPAGTTVSVAWFDFVYKPGENRTADSYAADLGDIFVNGGGGSVVGGEDVVFTEHRAFLPQGNDLPLEGLSRSGLASDVAAMVVSANGESATMQVREAKRLCALNPACAGITFPLPAAAAASAEETEKDEQLETGEVATAAVDNLVAQIHLKGTADKLTNASGWVSFVKAGVPQRRMNYLPQHCGAEAFGDPHLPTDLSPLGKRVCMARFINHQCDASMKVVIRPPPSSPPSSSSSRTSSAQTSSAPTSSPTSSAAAAAAAAATEVTSAFMMPDSPYSLGRSVRAFHVVTRRAVRKGQELSLNYFLLPGYMAKPPEFVNNREACYKSFGEAEPGSWGSIAAQEQQRRGSKAPALLGGKQQPQAAYRETTTEL